MRLILRHLLAILVLPFSVAVLVPLWIARRNDVALTAPQSFAAWGSLALGTASAAVGLALFGASVALFASRGRGTLAPWDPPRRFVVAGPYRYVRNPMISGVLFVLAGEALVLRSWLLAAWTAAFLTLNAVVIPAVEEPRLAARFGDDYAQYTAHVRRFIPRLRPWRG